MPMRQVVMARKVFTEATTFLGRRESLANGIAVSLAQDAAELLLRAICKQHSLPGKLETFDALITAIDSHLRDQHGVVPNQVRLRDLNKARVNFKHYGLLPERTSAQECVDGAEAFLVAASQQYFNVDFASVSLTELVQHDGVRKHLLLADAALGEGKHRDAIFEATRAFHYVEKAIQSVLPTPTREMQNIGSKVGDPVARSLLDQWGGYMSSYLERVNTVLYASTLNLDAREILVFLRLKPSYLPGVRGGEGQIIDRMLMYTEEQAISSVNLVRQVALAVEASPTFGLKQD